MRQENVKNTVPENGSGCFGEEFPDSMDIHANLSTEEYSIVEEETADSTKSELGRSKHPSTGFPAIQSRRGPR